MRNTTAYFDGHCDTVSRCLRRGEGLRQNSGHVDLARGGAFAAYAQLFALFADAPSGRAFAQARRQRDFLMRQLAENADCAVFCRTAAQVRRAVSAGKTAALLGLEGAELLDCDPARVETAAAWGARYVTLTWNHENDVSGAHCDGAAHGLTARGRDFVRALRQNGILPDVSHLSDAGFWDVMELGAGPVIASHSNSRAVCAHSRNLTDEMFRAVAQSGGVVGLNFYADFIGGAADFAQLLRHVEHFLALGGEDCLCLGGDMDGCARLGAGLRGLEDVPALCAAFRARGYGAALLRKLFFENWLRVLRLAEVEPLPPVGCPLRRFLPFST